MQKNNWCGLCCFSFFFVFLLGCTASSNSLFSLGTVRIGNATIQVELATTPKQHAQGLMNRDFLAPDSGMLFVFNSSQQLWFWMKNTKIPLDMLFLDANKTVVQIMSAPPCVQDPCQSYGGAQAQYVLEVHQGFAALNNIEVGTQADFSNTY